MVSLQELRARARALRLTLVKSRKDGTFRIEEIHDVAGKPLAGMTLEQVETELDHQENWRHEWLAAGRPVWTACGVPLNEAAEKRDRERCAP